ncbi:HNH endonuclease [Variovorax sp. RB2P76]|uniref:HNH endonuclease n=1 Tax=Variovorax sp. RB2P76 TaxID=3443736 RepID=UPI003F44862B
MITATCIYCGKTKPFTDEHVFPAGMGGDDPNYILRNLVCGGCNTNVFSPLEAQLMRNSPYALARLHQQPTSRVRGNKSGPPEFAHDRCEMVDEDGHVSEAQLVVGGKPMTLSQIQILDGQVRLEGNDDVRITAFLAELPTLLGNTARVIVKIPAAEGAKFEVTEYAWDGHDYLEKGKTLPPKPPAGIWLDSLAGSEGQAIGWPRIYKRHHGQIVLRVMEPADAASFLSGTKRTLPTLAASPIPAARLVERPVIRVGMKAEPQKIFRAMAKIGVNFACHEYGDQTVRSSAFDSIRGIIMNGGEGVPLTDMAHVQAMFSSDERSVHVVMLFPRPFGGEHSLAVLIRLYGGGIQMFLLAESVGLPPETAPVVFVVHYLENKIERLSLTSYVHYLTMQMRLAGTDAGDLKALNA